MLILYPRLRFIIQFNIQNSQMLLLLPCIYVYSFVKAFLRLLSREPHYILLFFVFGLPIYITSLSISYQYGLKGMIPVMQSFKEVLVLSALGFLLYRRKEKIVFTWPDKLVLAFFLYTALYVFLPMGTFGFGQKMLALKSLSFFPCVYFTGRLMDLRQINLSRYFHYICVVAILAGIVLAFEIAGNQHLQSSTGYAEFNRDYFGMEPAGNYGLSWTFETANGLKRFASFFGGPLELGANTIFTLACIIALSTTDDNRIRANRLLVVTFLVTCFSILFAISRASMASYFIIIYIYALVTHRRKLLKAGYYTAICLVLIVLFFLRGDVYELAITTFNFTDTSSAFHIVQWLDGLQAIGSKPLGLGLGMSGRVSSMLGDNIGGENQMIIIGVQTGVIAIAIYLAIYISAIRLSLQAFRENKGKIRQLALTVLLVKIGLIIPTFTANVESYVYISYITWLCFGLLVAMTANRNKILDTGYAEKK